MRPPRTPATLVTFAALLLAAAPARAETPDPAVAFVTGAAITFAGFAAGGIMLGRTDDGAAKDRAGWLTMASGFALAPLAAHAVVGEWSRGALFAAAPAASLGATIGLFEYSPNAVSHGTLEVQRWLWGFFGFGFFSSAIGVVDAGFAPRRDARAGGLRLTPMAGRGSAGLLLEGAL
jgi:hypothetical protein